MLHLARAVKHRFYTQVTDYLQMLTETYCNEELPSFYVVMFSLCKINNARYLYKQPLPFPGQWKALSEGWLRSVT